MHVVLFNPIVAIFDVYFNVLNIMKTNSLSFFFVLFLGCGVNAQQSTDIYFDQLNAAGYTQYNLVSFEKSKIESALTGLYMNKSDANPLMYGAEILPGKEGAKVIFRDYQPCVAVTNSSRLLHKIIKINGQKIEAYYGCGPSKSGAPNSIYMIKSEAGNDFAKKEFTDNPFVFVQLENLPIPFDTKGFLKVLSEASGKAL